MAKIKMLGLALGLAFVAAQSNTSAVALTCQEKCRIQYEECQVICSKNPCLISCELQARLCLQGCGGYGEES